MKTALTQFVIDGDGVMAGFTPDLKELEACRAINAELYAACEFAVTALMEADFLESAHVIERALRKARGEQS